MIQKQLHIYTRNTFPCNSFYSYKYKENIDELHVMKTRYNKECKSVHQSKTETSWTGGPESEKNWTWTGP